MVDGKQGMDGDGSLLSMLHNMISL